MADFGFVGASYEAPSIYQNAQECINWFPEIDPTKAAGQRGVVALYPTPGLTSVANLFPQAEVRGMRTLSGGDYMVAVCGFYVYILNSAFTPKMIGQLETGTGRVGITDNGISVYITDGLHRYSWFIHDDPDEAIFTGSISGTTLTVTFIKEGTIGAGQQLFCKGILNETVITGQLSGTTGGIGTYSINLTQTIASEQMYITDVAATLTSAISGTTLTVSAISADSTLYPGMTIQGVGVQAKTIITALGSGTVLTTAIAAGGSGYSVNDTITLNGGVYGVNPATYTVATVSGTAVATLTTTSSGQYTSNPINPASTTTNGSGTGLTLNLTFGTGTGGTGNYVVNYSQTVGSETMYALRWSVMPDTDGAFTGGTIVDIVDNYFVYNRPDTQQWAATNILSPITNGLSFASKFTGPDDLVSIICDHGQVYLLGETTSEVWADVGTYPFPFQRIPGSSSQHGIIAPFSMARIGNSFAYLSRNTRGQAEIVLMNGYFPTRISTHAVENTLVNQYVEDAVAYTYQLEGHEIFVISFPTLDLTWAYDIATQMWHKWLWVDSNNVYHRHRSNCGCSFQNQFIVGDWENGQIYKLDRDNYTDNGGIIRRVRRAPHLVTDLQRQYFDELQIQFQPGVGLNGIAVTGEASTETVGAAPQAMLRWSNDGGSTWSNEHWANIGLIGKYQNRIIWRRLGWSRDRIFEVVVTDPVKAVIVSANLKASSGEN
ncbi:Bacteriophage P22, Gp10, DNA-stabilising [uncultured Caudovirales phage]|uniref:Bacteriophage P22, Gp10, DNA-stabilising n=1 Tax=uncultured Caudovirales phage TaxID=2100421 RepID=A0A6J5KQS9_9CAUD|nr:Bacteriophage P22, Gp10, DNA-stabilising [uncultured Caudovirales phage]